MQLIDRFIKQYLFFVCYANLKLNLAFNFVISRKNKNQFRKSSLIFFLKDTYIYVLCFNPRSGTSSLKIFIYM
jgi:hypothetical protein